jgi:hypothetical protein
MEKDKWIQYLLVSGSYEIREQKEVLVWYTGIYRPISSTAYIIYKQIYRHILGTRYNCLLI